MTLGQQVVVQAKAAVLATQRAEEQGVIVGGSSPGTGGAWMTPNVRAVLSTWSWSMSSFCRASSEIPGCDRRPARRRWAGKSCSQVDTSSGKS
ncbi:Macrophage Mannose Receptor 1 [Manis pentadactyla]|nr:Macrophage Mannose Receptor 1 [Manis pentadactyla]